MSYVGTNVTIRVWKRLAEKERESPMAVKRHVLMFDSSILARLTKGMYADEAHDEIMAAREALASHGPIVLNPHKLRRQRMDVLIGTAQVLPLPKKDGE